jgi:twinkle protein
VETEESTLIKKVQCPKCADEGKDNSGDNLSIYSDGHGFCFGGHGYFSSEERLDVEIGELRLPVLLQPKTPEAISDILESGQWGPMNSRKIFKETVKHFGVKQVIEAGEVVQHLYPYYDQDGNGIQALKIRKVKTKDFITVGDFKDVELFGQHLFPAPNPGRGDKLKVTVVEGELDALAHYQMVHSRWPVVSLPTGSGGIRKAFERSYNYLDSFGEIILSFDSDEPGREAAEVGRELFPEKARVVEHAAGFKDACDYLVAGESEKYRQAWWNAKAWEPEGLVVAADSWDRVSSYTAIRGLDFPWPGMTRMTHGLMDSQFVLCVSGTGMGKTCFSKEFIHHFKGILKPEQNIGAIFLEEPVEETMLDLMSLEAGKILYDYEENGEVSKEEKKEIFTKSLGDNRIFLMNYDGAQNYDKIEKDIKYLVRARGCKQIYLDHISRVVDRRAGKDEREQLDLISESLDNLRISLGIQLFVNIHTNRSSSGTPIEEGGRITLDNIRGSSTPGKVCQIGVGFERNTQAEDPIERNTTKVRLLKVRKGGFTGICDTLQYDQKTGRLKVVQEELSEDGFIEQECELAIEGEDKSDEA